MAGQPMAWLNSRASGRAAWGYARRSSSSPLRSVIASQISHGVGSKATRSALPECFRNGDGGHEQDQAGYGTDGTFHDQQSSLSVVEDHEGTQTNGCADDGQRTPPPWGRQGDRDSGCAAENGGSRHQMQRSNQRVESVPETA